MFQTYSKLCAGLLLLCLAAVPAVRAQVFEGEAVAFDDGGRAARESQALSFGSDGHAARESRPAHTHRQQARAHESNAMLLAEAGKTSEAIAEDRAAIADDPDRPGYRIFLASLLIDAGKLKCALHVYEYVCQRFPEQTPYLSDSMQQLRMVLNMLAVEDALAGPETSVQAARSDCGSDHNATEEATF